ncbi:MAG: tandem-95 repeat protein, partial [Pseudobdellovibrionaceae bacterium]
YMIRDYDGDTATAKLDVNVSDADTVPTIDMHIEYVDETNLPGGPIMRMGNFNADFKDDGPGTYAFNGTVMAVKDSLGTALNLTSGGKAVDVSVTATLITGTSSDGRTIFTATLDPNTGKYVFNLFDTIDHPDASNPNDVIWLKFGVDGIDADGDRASTFLQIDVADDGPVAHDDVNATVNTSVSGNVLNNDELSQDAPTPVIKVSFNGTDYAVNATGSTTVQGVYGTLVIKADGSYTYTSKNTGVGTDHFTYMIRDYDGDTSTAKLDLSVGDLDTTPTIQDSTCTTDETYLWAGSPSGGVIDITNTIVADFKADGPGTFKFTGTSGVSGSVAGGSLTSHGQAVSFQITDTTIKAVSADGRTIFETVLNPSTGQYNTKVYDTIDHADGTNMNDLITFNFGVMATDSDGDSATGKIILNIYDDAPIAQDDGSTVVNTSVSGNVLTNDYVSQDEPTPVIRVNFNGTNYNVPATGSATIQGVYGTLVIKADGSYTYTSKNTGTGVDHFTYTIRDYDGDTSTAKLDLAVNDIDTTPIATQANNMVDETNMHSVSGTVSVDYKADGPGTVSATSAGSFSSDGSLLGGALTSKGQAVTVSLSGNTYTGTAGGREIFTLVINANGSYTFTQKDQLDHADGANPNDVINLHFGYKATDSDGDVANSQINIAVKDDAPVAHDDSASIPNGANSVTGNVLTNDTVGYDEPGKVIKVTFNGTDHTVSASGNTTIVGAHGTLVINANGAYTYTSANASTGTDQFTYMMRDNDGDTSTANLNLTVGDVDTTPIATQENAMVDETNMHSVSGTVDVDYKADGPGTVSATSAGSFSSDGSLLGGALTSKGQSVSVSLSGNTYTGTAGGRTVFTLQINSDGTYTFNQLDQLDHADKNNPNDVINLHFGYKATDTDGDTATSTINIAVKDDAPVAHDDSASIPNGSNSVNGNVLTNDSSGFDDNATVIRVSFNGTDYTVPSSGTRTITGDHGTLVIKADGSFTYTSANASTGTDHFTYMIQDHDGDMAQANLDLTVGDLDTTPTVQNSICTTDETYLWSGSPSAGVIELTNTIVADFKADGPGTFKFNGGSSVAGSVAGGSLTSHGQAVTFQITNTTIKAVSADGRTIFETTLNANTGEYRTQVYDTIDHADGNNTNDLITFNFGVTVTDSDGDSANANVILEIYDDAPIAVDDGGNTVNGTISGNVMVNDYVSQDDATIVTKVSFNGTDYSVPATGTRTVGGVYGTLVIKADGSYTYTSKNTATGVDNFTYTIRDYDGDTSTAKLGFAVNDIDTTPIATNAAGSVDETATRTYNGTVNVDYQADGVGTVMPTNASSFNATGSLLGGALTSKGQAVTVSLSGDTYTGMAGGREVFTLKINSDSTYTFTLKDQLDHADGSNANDVINLAFGYKAVDTDGDTASATITIAVKDDVPVARDDTGNIPHGATSTTGNVLANDSTGFDEGIVVSKVNFGGSDHAVAASGTTTIQGTYGTLVIKADGSYTYTTKNTATGTDHFTYTIHDHDGDAATANLNLTVQDTDATPTITTTVCTTDETFLWAGSPSGGVISLTNTAHVDYGGDGPGTLAFTGSFQAVGSLKNNALTSDGYPINVNVTANSVTGTSSDGRTIFTISLNQSTGAYSIRVFDTLDHADGNNMNDLITFNIGIKATDADGDVGTGTVVLEVYDDAPIAINDGVGAVSPNQGRVDGNVFTNDYVSVEGQKLTSIRWGSTANHSVGTAGFALLGLYGTLYIYNNGQYTYIAKNTGQGTDTFTYTVTDGDGDIATAQLSVLVQNGGASTLSSTSFAPTTSNVSGSEFVADDDMTSSSSNAHQTQGLSSSDPTAMDSSEVLHHDFLVQPEGRTVIAGTNAADTIQGSAEDEVIEGKGGSDNIHAGDGNDVVYGGAGNDVIYGDDGADIIYDGAGADIVHGGAGDDILVVGGKAEGETGLDGANDLWGDGGADTFLFAQGSQIGTNTIHDFSTAEGDVVDLSDFLHNYDPVTQSIDAFVFQRETSEGTVISVDVNGSGDAAKAVDIVVLDNVHGHDIEDLVLNAQKVQDAA